MAVPTTDRVRGTRLLAWLLSGALVCAAAAPCRGEVPGGRRWSGEPKASLVAAGHAVWHPDSSAQFGSLAGSLAAEFSSTMRPARAGLFTLYRITSGTEEGDSLQVGGWTSADFSRWQASFASAYVDPRIGAGHAYYAGNLRYHVLPDHWLGLEASGRVGDGRPHARLVYQGRIAGMVALQISVGYTPGGRSEAAAHTEVVWRIR